MRLPSLTSIRSGQRGPKGLAPIRRRSSSIRAADDGKGRERTWRLRPSELQQQPRDRFWLYPQSCGRQKSSRRPRRRRGSLWGSERKKLADELRLAQRETTPNDLSFPLTCSWPE